MKKNKDNWDTSINDFIENGVVKRIKKPKKRDWKFIIVGIFAILLTFWVAGLHNKAVEKSQVKPTIQVLEYAMIQINGKDAIMWKNPDGTKSARVQYEKCEEVATISGMVNHCDRRIINCKFEI